MIDIDDSDEMLLNLAIEFANNHSHFDATFIESLQEFSIRYGALTPKQRKALQNIIHKWNMIEWGRENL